MEQKMERDVLQKLKRRRRSRVWTRVVSMMMCIVVFCTTYALILPAITKETDTFCEIEAHIHTAACYPQQGDLICEFADEKIHVHSDECNGVRDSEPSCALAEIAPHSHTEECVPLEEKLLVCTLQETEGHSHSDDCQPLIEQSLSCSLAETAGHTHGETCQKTEEKNLTCEKAETAGHTHGETCQKTEEKNLTCNLAETAGHTHGEACGKTEEKNLTCNLAETEGHSHTAECSKTETVISCALAESAGHAHGDSCYGKVLTCSLSEDETHSHGDGCYTTQLSCGQAEAPAHAHEGGCYSEVVTNVCGQQEAAAHGHEDSCYSVRVTYGCGQAEAAAHGHEDSCYSVRVTYGCGQQEAAAHGHEDSCYHVTVSYGCGLEAVEPHSHGDDCYSVSATYSCALEEAPAHAHGDGCYTMTTTYGCGLEAVDPHSHGDGCHMTVYSCGLQETEGHAHGDGCYHTTYGCGLDALVHTHTDECYAPSPALICTLEDHTHDVACFTGEPICGLEAHEHTLQCYSDPTADLEGASYWESTLPGSLTGNYAEDLLAVARSQLGYVESTRNYIVNEETGDTMGYTRYGAWYGFPHGDWCAMFVSFCLNYAKIDTIPLHSSCSCWVDELKGMGRYEAASDYTPKSGDIIFFDWNGDRNPDHVGIVAKYFPPQENDAARIQCIEGNSGDCVRYTSYNLADPDILGYGIAIDAETYARQNAVRDMIALIDQLPTAEEVEQVMTEYEEAGDLTGQDAYFLEVTQQAADVYGRYTQLSESQQSQVTNADKLLALWNQWCEPELPEEELLRPEDTIAWAELVGTPITELPEEPEAAAEEAMASRTYDLRRMNSASFAVPRAGTPLDLTEYIRKVTMFDAAGNEIASGSTVTEGDQIEFRIEYNIEKQILAEMNGANLTVHSNTVYYQIPDTFKVIRDSSGKVYNSQLQEVGSFTVDANTNRVSITFDDFFVEANATGLDIDGKVSFYSTVTKITEEDDEKQDFKFTDEITLGIVIQEDIEAVGSIEIEKQKISVDGEDLVYEIKVFSEEGTTGPITITDKMSAGLTFLEGIEVRKGNTLVRDATFVPAADRSSFTMTLPEMAPGDSYTLRYRCKADIKQLGADMTVNNTATVKAKDNKETELEDDFTVEHTFKLLEKTGTPNADGSISWTITINRDKLDISGWTLEDYTGGTNALTEPVTIRGSNGVIIAANQKLPYTFPEGSKDTYTVTYTTNSLTATTNRAVLKKDGNEFSVTTGVNVGTPTKKTGTISAPAQDAEGNYLVSIDWTVTIDTTGGSIPAGGYLYDRLSGDPSDDMYMTYEQLMGALANIEAELRRVSGQGASRFEAEVFLPGYGTGRTYTRAQLEANQDNCHSMKFETFKVWVAAEVPQGNLLTFAYDAYGIFPNNTITNTTYVNQFDINGYHRTEGKVQHSGGSVEAFKYALPYFDPADLDDNLQWYWGLDWSGVNGTTKLEYEKLKNGYLAWAIEVDVPPAYSDTGAITLRENLPEGLTVKGIDFIFMNDIPTKGLALRNMAPGKTVNSTVTIYPADQYNTYQPQGAQDVTISTTLTTAGDLEIVIPGEFLKNMSRWVELYDTTDGVPEWYIHLYIYTQINEDFPWTPTDQDSLVFVNNFENTLDIYTEDGTRIDHDYQNQQVKKNERDTMIRKDVKVEDSVLKYSVLLNSAGRDLVPNSATLHVLDELTYTSTAQKQLRLRLVPSTVKLYEAVKNADGTYSKGAQISRPYTYNEDSTESGGVTSWTHTLEMEIPDGKTLILEYAYGATGDKDARHQVQNVCSIEGYGDGILEGDSKLELEVKDSEAEANVNGIVIYKVDANNNGLYLQNAKFNVYIWNKNQGKYILVHHPEDGDAIFTTNTQGLIALDSKTVNPDQFAYNTAYYIQEIASPDGYYLSPEPYYFYIAHDDTSLYPYYMPEGFQGRGLVNGDIIYRENVSDTTQISVEKYWKDQDGNSITVTKDNVSSITLELWQMLQGEPGSAKLYDTYTMTPDEKGNWSLTITGLPRATKNVNGTKGTNYFYYIKEVGVNNYELESAENNTGINSGTIKLVNRKLNGYTLPETGGAGTNLYTMAGLLLMLTSAAYLMYQNRPRRREEV